VGWCPLGWGNRAVAPFPHGRGYYGVTPYRGAEHVRGGHGGRGPSDPWSAWNVVRADHFRSSRPVWRHAVDGRSLPTEQRSAFVDQRVPPRLQAARPVGTAGTRVLTAPRAPERAAARGSIEPGATRPVARQGERVNTVNTPATGRTLPAGSSTATSRWTPPPVHYGIPPTERAEPSTGAGRDGGMAPTYRSAIPGLARPRAPVESPVERGDGAQSTRSPDPAGGIYRAPRPSSGQRGLSTPSWGSAPRQTPAPARPAGGPGMAAPRGDTGAPHGSPSVRGAAPSRGAPSRGAGGAPAPASRGATARPRSR